MSSAATTTTRSLTFRRETSFTREYAGGYRDRARVHAKKGDFKRAVADLTRAIELSPPFSQELRWTDGGAPQPWRPRRGA